MKVADLIKKLQQLPADAWVVTSRDDHSFVTPSVEETDVVVIGRDQFDQPNFFDESEKTESAVNIGFY